MNMFRPVRTGQRSSVRVLVSWLIPVVCVHVKSLFLLKLVLTLTDSAQRARCDVFVFGRSPTWP